MDSSFVVPFIKFEDARSDEEIVASGDDARALRVIWEATSRNDLQSMRGFYPSSRDCRAWWNVAASAHIPDVWLPIVWIGVSIPSSYALYVDRARRLYVQWTLVDSKQVYLTPMQDMDHAVRLLSDCLEVETQPSRIIVSGPNTRASISQTRKLGSVSLEVARGLWRAWRYHTRSLAEDADAASRKIGALRGATGDVVLVDAIL